MAGVMVSRVNCARLSTYAARRCYSQTAQKGLVLGVYTDKNDSIKLTENAQNFNSKTKGKLLEHLNLGSVLKKGKTRVFWGLSDEFPAIALVGLGSADAAYDQVEEIDEARENIRIAAGAGCKALQSSGVSQIVVEDLGSAQQAAEGSTLSLYCYQKNKLVKNQQKVPEVSLYSENKSSASEWSMGIITAGAQNFARDLAETPANLMTPTIFSETVANEFEKLGIKVTIRDQKWAEEKKMFSFLSVARGSDEPPKFLELSYKNPKYKGDKPIVLVGKGVTFDTGGISLKPSANMASMRGDMGGAACVVGTFRAAAQLDLPVNLVGLIPLTENMPNGRATKPGDVFTAMNGKNVLVDNTDAEGRLILADALCYSNSFDPVWVADLATLTGAIRVSLGCVAAGVFTKNTGLWNAAQAAAARSGDRLWRMPLWNYHTKSVTDYKNVDVHNVGKSKGGGSCTAAAFLSEFAPANVPWMHIDIAGVMEDADDQPYINKGMTGRPTRTIIELIQTKGI